MYTETIRVLPGQVHLKRQAQWHFEICLLLIVADKIRYIVLQFINIAE